MTLAKQIKKIWSLLDRRTRIQLGGLFFLMLIGSLLEMVGLGMFIPLLQVVSAPDRLASTFLVGDLYAAIAPNDPVRFFLMVAGALFVFFVAKNLYLGALIYVQNRFVMIKQAAFSRDLMAAYLRRPYLFFVDRNTAELLRNLQTSGPSVFFSGLQPLLGLCLELLLAIGVVICLLAVEPIATLAVSVVLGLSAAVFFRVMHRHVLRWGRDTELVNAGIIKSINEGLGAVKEVMVLGREDHFVSTFAKPNFARAHVRALVSTSSYMPRLFIEAVVIAGMFLVGAVILWRGYSLNEVVPVLGIFAIGAFRLVPSASRVVTAVLQLKEGSAALQNVYDDYFSKHVCRPDDQGKPPLAFSGDIVFEGVSFRYAGASIPAVLDFSIRIGRGESVAFVGSSGAGKTTVIDILLGLIEPTSGRLLIDGKDVRTHMRSWQDRLGYVPQTIYLLDDTLRRNIAFGYDDADIDEARVRRAVELARLDAVVADLPKGLDTIVGEKGVRLSGGQRQRIGIARALYHDPDVLVMDEATSSLDSETEQEISRAIASLSGNKTIVLIAHRMSTVLACNRLFVVEKGRLVDSGSFDELARRNQDFQRMIRAAQLTKAEAS